MWQEEIILENLITDHPPPPTDLVIGVFVPRATVSDTDESVEATVRVVRGAVRELEAVTVGLSAVGQSAAGI